MTFEASTPSIDISIGGQYQRVGLTAGNFDDTLVLKRFQDHGRQCFLASSVSSHAELAAAVTEDITVPREFQNVISAAGDLLNVTHFGGAHLNFLSSHLSLFFFKRENLLLLVLDVLLAFDELLFLDLIRLRILVSLLERLALLVFGHVVVSGTEAFRASPLHVLLLVGALISHLVGTITALRPVRRVAEGLPLFDLLVDMVTAEWVGHAGVRVVSLLLIERSHAEALVR